MKRITFFSFIIIAIMTTGCASSIEEAVPANSKIMIQSNIQIVKFDKNQLVNESDVIISGTVISQEVQKNFEGFPATDTTIKVQNVLKGNPGETVEIRVDGGETEDMIYELDKSMNPDLQINQEVIVFLSANKGSRTDKDEFGYYIVGQSQGKFIIADQSNSYIENKAGTLRFDFKEFRKEISSIEKYNKENNTPRLYLPEGTESNI